MVIWYLTGLHLAASRCSQFLHYKVKSFTLFLIKDQNHSVSSADFSDNSINEISLPTPPVAGSFPSMPRMGIDPPLAESVSLLGKANIFQSIAAGSTHQVSKLRALV
jgi:hypothetical protein